jgi:hypothetical protein
LQEARYKDYTAKRRTVGFGSDPPGFLLPLQAKTAAWLRVPAAKLKHVVCGISLGGACRMRFRPAFHSSYAPRKNRNEILSLELAPRSAYVLRDDAVTFRTLA